MRGLICSSRNINIWHIIIILAIVLCVIVLIASTLIFSGRGKSQVYWVTNLSADVPEHGKLIFKQTYGGYIYDLTYYCLRWEKPSGQVAEYCIWIGGNGLGRIYELRATSDYNRVWIVAHDDYQPDHVIASLDLKAERFINENGILLDPKLPLDKQEETGWKNGQLGHPSWATPDGGTIIAQNK